MRERKYKLYGPNGEDRLLRLYFNYECSHCGYKGISNNGPRFSRCYNQSCEKPVELINYKSLDEQEAVWIEEEKNKQRQSCVLYIK
jgi:hypothetical protein